MDVDNMAAPRDLDSKSPSRSCTTCSKAKAKCVRRTGEDICERCSRLRKTCESREPVVRRRKQIKSTRAAQLEKLETKIEHLVNALSTQQIQRGYSTDLGHPSPISNVSESSASASVRRSEEILHRFCDPNVDDSPPDRSNSVLSLPTTTTSPSSTSLYTTTSSVTSPGSLAPDYQTLGVTMSEAEILLDRFRRLMAHTFPFVPISANSTARQMFSEKPLLLHSIVTVTYFHDLPKQQNMLKCLMRDISERTLINGEKSLDLMQGILILVAWYHPHVFHQQQTTNLLHLAQALATDMQIDRAPALCEGFKHQAAKAGHAPPGSLPNTKRPSNDELRALAGTYFMSSLFSTCFKRVEGMKYTKFLDDGVKILEQEGEHESDGFLIQMVRLQHLIDESTKTDHPAAPMQMFVKAFTVDLERLKQADPNREYNPFLQMQYLATETTIWEMSLNDLQDNNAKPLRSHLDDLVNLTRAIKAYIDVFFTIPASSYLALPFYFFGQFGHAFMALIRLSSLEVEGWDMKDLHDEYNFSAVIEEVAKRYEDASRYGPDGLAINNDSFSKWAVRVRWMKQVYESRFTPDSDTAEDRPEVAKGTPGKPAQDYNPLTPAQQQPTPPDDMLSGDFFNYLDENFWQSFAGDVELGFPDMAMT